jgi:hypothetical protein
VVASQDAVGGVGVVHDVKGLVHVAERRGLRVFGQVTKVRHEDDVVGGSLAAVGDDVAEGLCLRLGVHAALGAPVHELRVGHDGQRESRAVRVGVPTCMSKQDESNGG